MYGSPFARILHENRVHTLRVCNNQCLLQRKTANSVHANCESTVTWFRDPDASSSRRRRRMCDKHYFGCCSFCHQLGRWAMSMAKSNGAQSIVSWVSIITRRTGFTWFYARVCERIEIGDENAASKSLRPTLDAIPFRCENKFTAAPRFTIGGHNLAIFMGKMCILSYLTCGNASKWLIERRLNAMCGCNRYNSKHKNSFTAAPLSPRNQVQSTSFYVGRCKIIAHTPI